jgi:hypothetical protein
MYVCMYVCVSRLTALAVITPDGSHTPQGRRREEKASYTSSLRPHTLAFCLSIYLLFLTILLLFFFRSVSLLALSLSLFRFTLFKTLLSLFVSL